MARKKVLIIVGGGIFGVVPAQFLAYLPHEEQNLDKVDVLSGCSIGGILAAAYATGQSFETILNMFVKNADQCFTKRLAAYFNLLTNPTYDADELYKVLDSILGNFTMGQTREAYPHLDLFIPGLNITDDKYKVFDNVDGKDDHIMLKDVAAITSAAPSYFKGRTLDGKCYIDGGLIEVAPLITAVTAEKSKRDVKFEDMDVLMLGTGKDISDKPLTEKRYNGLTLAGLALDVIVPYTTLGNELATAYWGNNMGFNYFNYFNPCTNNGKLDDTSVVPDMIKQCEQHKEEFLKVWYEWLNK